MDPILFNMNMNMNIKNLVKNLEKIRCINYPFLNILKNEKLVIIIIIIIIIIILCCKDLSEDISSLNIMCITRIRNSVPETELKDLNTSKFYNSLIENLLSVLQTYPFYKIKDLGKVFILRTYLFNLIQLPPDKILNYQELEVFREGVLNLLQTNNGYLNNDKLESSKLLNFFRSSHPEMKLVYKEVECFHSLIILILLLEYELYTMYYEDLYNSNNIEKGTLKNFLSDIKETKRNLRNLLTFEVKVLISKTRINLMNKIYSGFDTEFQMLSSDYNELLAYTTCSYSKQFICIKNLDLNISESVCKEQLVEMVKILRFLNKKYDVEIDELSTFLSQDKELIEKMDCKEYSLYSKREDDLKKVLVTNFYDLENKINEYSIRALVVKSLESQKSRIDEMTEFHQVYLKKVRLPRIPVKKEVCLIAHFTTADVTSLADFQEFKSKFSILRKSFVTLERNIRLEGWKVILRDTSLLSPGNASLKAIGELYSREFNKISIPDKMKSKMKVLKKESFSLFSEYAKQDAVITL